MRTGLTYYRARRSLAYYDKKCVSSSFLLPAMSSTKAAINGVTKAPNIHHAIMFLPCFLAKVIIRKNNSNSKNRNMIKMAMTLGAKYFSIDFNIAS